MTDSLKAFWYLAGISAVCGALLGVAHARFDRYPGPTYANRLESTARQALPPGATVISIAGKEPLPNHYWAAAIGSATVAYAFPMHVPGFSEPAFFMAVIDTLGQIIRLADVSRSMADFSVPVSPVSVRFEGLSVLMPITVVPGSDWSRASLERREEIKGANAVAGITGATVSLRALANTLSVQGKNFLLAAMQKR
jgi:hypothetical protein